MHIGSQLFRLDPYIDGVERLSGILDAMRGEGIDSLRSWTSAAGSACRIATSSPDLARFARALATRVQPTGLTLPMEPGRFIVGNAGILLTRVLYRKHSGGRDFLVSDAGMTELLRPSHYDAYHRIEPVRPRGGTMSVDSSAVCESGDFWRWTARWRT